jgi:hypothetical protein
LAYYEEKKYTLVVLGDVEELWEEDAGDVLAAYPEVFSSEAQFYDEGRLMRVYGNHDDFWHYQANVAAHLDPTYPGIEPVDGVVLAFARDGAPVGELLLVHGNQGVFELGLISEISRIAVRWFWRTFQILTGKGRTTPAQDACLRGRHDTCMYNWADEQTALILIAGHTHRPVWSSMTHLEQLRDQLYTLQAQTPRPQNYAVEVTRLQAQIDKVAQEHPPCNDSFKTNPCYFNTGCCSFGDGDITGIEIEGGWIRLVKWDKDDGTRVILQEALLSDLFDLLPKKKTQSGQ